MRDPGLTATSRRLLGVAFIAAFATLLGMCVAIYNDSFTDVVPVTLHTDKIGNQLRPQSDVKVRGVLVGEVAAVRATSQGGTVGDGAVIELALQPEMVSQLPSNVSARLLPKTLFGERFVSLVLPETPSAERLGAGDVIPQDRSQLAIELERVLNGLLPLLQAVAPQDLAVTLNALSQTLENRGAQLGETLTLTHRYLSELNTALPDLQADISGLADVAETYNRAAPDLIAALTDFTVSSRTVLEQRQNLETLYATTTRAPRDLTAFLLANRDNLIRLAQDSRPTLELLARYSPQYPCMLRELTDIAPRLDESFGAGTDEPGLHITLEINENRGSYEPGQDEPVNADKRGPRCYPRVVPAPQYPPGGPVRDGSTPPPAGDTPPAEGDELGGGPLAVAPQSAAIAMGLPNSAAEQQFVASLLAAVSGKRPSEIPGWSTLLVGPLLRGTEVTLQ